MRQIIKENIEFNNSDIGEPIVSDEIVNSGNYNDAEKILQNRKFVFPAGEAYIRPEIT